MDIYNEGITIFLQFYFNNKDPWVRLLDFEGDSSGDSSGDSPGLILARDEASNQLVFSLKRPQGESIKLVYGPDCVRIVDFTFSQDKPSKVVIRYQKGTISLFADGNQVKSFDIGTGDGMGEGDDTCTSGNAKITKLKMSADVISLSVYNEALSNEHIKNRYFPSTDVAHGRKESVRPPIPYLYVFSND